MSHNTSDPGLFDPDYESFNLVPRTRLLDERFDSAFRTVVQAGWANRSTGDLSEYDRLIWALTIELPDLRELTEALFLDSASDAANLAFAVGAVGPFFIVEQDNDGVMFVWVCASAEVQSELFDLSASDYNGWLESAHEPID